MPTVLKRYANRRIYDTRLSRYITLEDMATRLREGEDFEVRDAATDEDLTRKILLQIIVLESLDVADLLPVDFLKLLIRLRSDRRLSELFGRYLRLSMDAFGAAQRQLEENMRVMQEQLNVTATLMKSFLATGGIKLGVPGSAETRTEPRSEPPPENASAEAGEAAPEPPREGTVERISRLTRRRGASAKRGRPQKDPEKQG